MTTVRFAELPLTPTDPPGAAWGVFGPDDEIGTLNLAGAEEIRHAASLVRRGCVFALNLELREFDPGLFHRGSTTQRLTHWPVGRNVTQDDLLDGFWLQGSSHWDALRHFGEEATGFYGGRTLDEVCLAGGGALGVDRWANRGIAARGVLADVARFVATRDSAYDPLGSFAIDESLLSQTLAAQGVQLRRGDILLLRTGWLDAYRRLDDERRERTRSATSPRSAGLGGPGIPAFLWNSGVAAVAADNPALEVLPSPEFELHRALITRLGMAIGELWSLDALAEDCARDGVYEGLLTSAPLNVNGGAGSPANALLLK
jgi:kynurenine formamidase